LEEISQFFYRYYFYIILHYFIVLILGIVIILKRRDPVAALAWILLILAVPYIGAIIYLILGRNRIKRKYRKKRRSDALLTPILSDFKSSAGHLNVEPDFSGINPTERSLIEISRNLSDFRITKDNEIEVLIDPNELYDRMEDKIRKARDHVHMEYYIFQPDETGRRFAGLLAEKAREGVEVRLLYDYIGSFSLNSSFLKPMIDAGVKCAAFLPVVPFWFWRQGSVQLRNHRKITVVDGRFGFAGGINIGDEYRGRRKKHPVWRDTHMMLQGPAVQQLQEVFAEDWFFAANENITEYRYFPDVISAGNQIVQIIASGPDYNLEAIQKIFFTAISSAQQRVYITTPYLVPDQAILTAMQSAALRGVDVRLLVPQRSDSKLVYWAGRSYYRELVEAGVSIYEYRPGILHAKMMVVDGRISTIGSANMDIRSFSLNFEVNAFIYGSELARQLEQIFYEDLKNSRLIDREMIEKESFLSVLVENTSRLLSPFL
jgi:cardiolipin synthase